MKVKKEKLTQFYYELEMKKG